MNPHAEALALLEALTRRGVEVRTEGGMILFRPAALLSSDDLKHMRALKPHLLELMEPAAPDLVMVALCAAADPSEARYLREERAAILEHLAGLPRAEADRRAGVLYP